MNPQLSENLQNENTTEFISIGELLTQTNSIENPDQYDKYKDVMLSPEEKQDFLNQKLTLTDLSLKQREQSTSEYLVEKNLDKAKEISSEGDQESMKTKAEAEKNVDTAIENIAKADSPEDLVDKAKDEAKKAGKSAYDLQFDAAMKDAEAALSSFKIWDAIKIFFKGLFGLYITKKVVDSAVEKGKDKAEDLAEGIKNNNTEFNDIKKDISQTVSRNLKISTKYLHPAIQERLNTAINNPDIFSGEDLQKLLDLKEKNGSIQAADIKSILGPDKFTLLINELINEDTNAELRLQMEKELLDKIYDEYGIDATNPEKKKKAEQLVKEYLSDVNFTGNEIIVEKLFAGETVTLGNLFEAATKSGLQFTGLILKLTTAGVIDAESIMLQFLDAGKNMLVLSVPFLEGFEGKVSKEELEEHFKSMPSEQRSLMLAILYRKTGLLSSILGNISAFSMRSLVELASPTPKASIIMMKDAALKGQLAQINTFKQFEKLLGGSAGANLLDESIRWTNTVTTNYSIMQALEGKNLKDAHEAIKKLQGTNLDDNFLKAIGNYDINKTGASIDDFRLFIANQVDGRINSARSVLDTKGVRDFFLRAEEIKFQNNMKAIVKHQTQAIKGGLRSLPTKTLTKFGEIFGSMEAPRNLDKLVLEANSMEKATTKMQALAKLAKDSPELLRTTFSALPTIAFLGLELSMNNDEDKSKMTQLMDSLMYITNVVGPIKLIMDTGATYKDGEIQWHEVSKGGVGMVLLGLDIKKGAKILAKNKGLLDILKQSGAYIIKPITDVGKFGMNLGKFGLNIADVIKGTGKFEMGKIMSNVGKNGKKIPAAIQKLPKRGKAAIATTVAIGGYLAIQGFMSENPDEVIGELQAQGILDNSGNLIPGKLQLLANDLNDEQKSFLSSMIISSAQNHVPDSGYDVKFENGKIKITSLTPEVGDWFVNGQPELIAALELYFPIKQTDIEFIPYNA